MLSRQVRAYGPVFLWMLLIFVVSTDVGSFENSGRIIGPIVRFFYPEATAEQIRVVQAVVRKTAHLVEYAILAILLWRARQIVSDFWRRWTWPEFAVILATCCLYAISDEWHQSWSPARQASALDVLIDTTGAALGLLLVHLWARKRSHHG